MEKVIYNLVYNRKRHLNAEGKALIQVEAYLNRRKRYFSTKVYVKPNQWDNNRHSIKNHPNMDALNLYLQGCLRDLEREELERRRWKDGFSLKDLGEKREEPDARSSFLAFMREEIARGDLRKSTQKNHLSTLRLLALYKRTISFEELDFPFLRGLERFMIGRKYRRNTIAKHMKHLKRYVNLAINQDLLDPRRYPFRKYKIRYQDTKRVHLTPGELGLLESLRLEGRAILRRSLDMFLFSCYTGLRFSDIVSITGENFQLINDEWWLVYSSAKTDMGVRLPLSLLFEGKALPIYERYKSPRSPLFRVSRSSNSNVNKHLRQIGRLAGIDKRFSFHAARHTNATLLLYKGANITTVQKLLGHRNVRTTEIYSDIMDMTLVRDLEKIACPVRSKKGI